MNSIKTLEERTRVFVTEALALTGNRHDPDRIEKATTRIVRDLRPVVSVATPRQAGR